MFPDFAETEHHGGFEFSSSLNTTTTDVHSKNGSDEAGSGSDGGGGGGRGNQRVAAAEALANEALTTQWGKYQSCVILLSCVQT